MRVSLRIHTPLNCIFEYHYCIRYLDFRIVRDSNEYCVLYGSGSYDILEVFQATRVHLTLQYDVAEWVFVFDKHIL